MKDAELPYSDSLKDLMRRNKKPYDLGKMAVFTFSVVPFVLLVTLVSKRNNFRDNTEMYSIILFLGISLFITVAASSFLLYLKYSKDDLIISKNRKINYKYSFDKKLCFLTVDILQQDKLITAEKISYVKMISDGDYGSELKIIYSNGEERNVEVGNIRFFYDITKEKSEKLSSYIDSHEENYGRLYFSFELNKYYLFDKNKESINNFILRELEIGSDFSAIIKGNPITIKRTGGKSNAKESEYFKEEYLRIIMDMDKDLITTSGDLFKEKIKSDSKTLIPLIIMLSSSSDKRSDGVSPKELEMMKKEIKKLFSIKYISEISEISELSNFQSSPQKNKVLVDLKKNIIEHSYQIIGSKITDDECDKMLGEFCRDLQNKNLNGSLRTVVSHSQKIIGALIKGILDNVSYNKPLSIKGDRLLETTVSSIVYSGFQRKLSEQEKLINVERFLNTPISRNPS